MVLAHTSRQPISHQEMVPTIGLAELKVGTISASGRNIRTETT